MTMTATPHLRRIADTCPVKRALEAGFGIDQSVVRSPALTPAVRPVNVPVPC
jgi:hypothetical protein